MSCIVVLCFVFIISLPVSLSSNFLQSLILLFYIEQILINYFILFFSASLFSNSVRSIFVRNIDSNFNIFGLLSYLFFISYFRFRCFYNFILFGFFSIFFSLRIKFFFPFCSYILLPRTDHLEEA